MIEKPPSKNTVMRQSLYTQLGGELAIKQMVKKFYDKVESKPEAEPLLRLHLRGNGMAHSRLEQFHFLSGFLGGPKLYAEIHGHSNVKTMHAHVDVDAQSKDIWLQCMSETLDEIGVEANLKQTLMSNFTIVAEQLVNRPNLSS